MNSSILSECVGCAKVCKMGAPTFNLRASRGPIFSLRALRFSLLSYVYYNDYTFRFSTWRYEAKLKWWNMNSFLYDQRTRGPSQNVKVLNQDAKDKEAYQPFVKHK